jgi:hypothetical protein
MDEAGRDNRVDAAGRDLAAARIRASREADRRRQAVRDLTVLSARMAALEAEQAAADVAHQHAVRHAEAVADRAGATAMRLAAELHAARKEVEALTGALAMQRRSLARRAASRWRARYRRLRG